MRHQRTAHSHRTILLFSLVALLALAAPLHAFAAQTSTQASVAFTDGDLEIGGTLGGSGMNFAFGTHPIPVKAATYPAENTVDHILTVEDARVTSGNWHVTAALTKFSDSGASTFNGVITLENPDVANANPDAGTAGLDVIPSISIPSEVDAVLVMAADETLPRGLFSATWESGNVHLNISNSEVANLIDEAYSATLTWTINIGPF